MQFRLTDRVTSSATLFPEISKLRQREKLNLLSETAKERKKGKKQWIPIRHSDHYLALLPFRG